MIKHKTKDAQPLIKPLIKPQGGYLGIITTRKTGHVK